MYSIDPDPESAHNPGIMFITRNDNEKAAGYLKEAVPGDNIDEETWVMISSNEQHTGQRLKKGDTYTVQGCINENTTVRPGE